ncbi:MAG: LysM peptidoglycan-binding domain-containing protein [Clostridia bacterium]|nr:LysM peptidoglycan-binding domain-containing protein [Clostridia bacterium]
MLKSGWVRFYKVKEGQTLEAIAAFFCVSAYLLAERNGLTEEPQAGVLLEIPSARGNAYTVKPGDTKTLLCGSEEAYNAKNTQVFYYGMRAIL